MSRYIDSTDISQQIADFKKAVKSPNSDYMTGYLCALSVTEGMIDSTPTADVVEVRHGYWKWEMKIEARAQNRLYCSCCDNECLAKDNYYVKSDFCPYCGAKMDGEKTGG
jgi:hypothetical protein